MKLKHYLTGVAALVLIAALTVMLKRDDAGAPPRIVTTTSVLSSIVEDIGAPAVQPETLVPAGSCPGHFDVKVQHLRLLEKSGMLLAHGFEGYLPDIQRSISNPGFSAVELPIKDSWLTLDGTKELYNKVAKELSALIPDKKEHFQKNLNSALDRIEETDRQIRMMAKDGRFEGKKIICNSHIKGMATYIGFDVTAVYGRREELTPDQISRLMDLCESEEVKLVIDNMQAGAETGKVFSEQLGIPHVAVSNFPGVQPDTDTLYETLLANTERIGESLGSK